MLTIHPKLSGFAGDDSGHGGAAHHRQTNGLGFLFRLVVAPRPTVVGARRREARQFRRNFGRTPAALQAAGERRTTGRRKGFRRGFDLGWSGRPLCGVAPAIGNPQFLGFPVVFRRSTAEEAAVRCVRGGAGTARRRASKPDRFHGHP